MKNGRMAFCSEYLTVITTYNTTTIKHRDHNYAGSENVHISVVMVCFCSENFRTEKKLCKTFDETRWLLDENCLGMNGCC